MQLSFRPIRPADDAAVASIIRTVMPEFGADGPGFAIHDPEVDHMAKAYSAPGASYFAVVDEADRVLGGGGFARLDGADEGTCELRKMYFLKEARGTGAGERLLRFLIEATRDAGYRTMYLETLTGMDAAMKLYTKLGFKPLCAPMGATGHTSCDRWYVMQLNSLPGDFPMKFEYLKDVLVLTIDKNNCIQFQPHWLIELHQVNDLNLSQAMDYRREKIDSNLTKAERRLINSLDPRDLVEAVRNIDPAVLDRASQRL